MAAINVTTDEDKELSGTVTDKYHAHTIRTHSSDTLRISRSLNQNSSEA